MKKVLLFTLLFLSTTVIFAQCGDLFFSEYVEGYSNNKAVEIYNPTGAAINLSGYSIARFSNGSTTASATNAVIQLPDVMLASHEAFVVVIDKRDTTLWDSQFDKPTWNGYNLIDTIFDSVTEEPVLDEFGEVLIGPQYNDEGSAIYGSDYDEKYDLVCKGDAFLCPVYDVNRTMYFNGNDAVALLTGTEVATDGSNLVDVIGVIGENPEDTIEEDAWVDADGFWLTKDRTLVRNADVAGGRNNLNDVVFSLGGTFTGEEWTSYPKNSFQYMGIHNSVCANPVSDEFLCSSVLAADEVNQVPFEMYPNPLNYGSLTIEAGEQIEGVQVYNLMGQLIFTEKVGFATDKVEVDLQNINAGMYLVNISFSENQVSIQKLIIE